MTGYGSRTTVPAPGTIRLADPLLVEDLLTYLGRAARADPDGAVRLVGSGHVLAGYVAPLHGGGGPTVLGLRVVPLAEPTDLDLTAPLAAVVEALSAAGPAGPDEQAPKERAPAERAPDERVPGQQAPAEPVEVVLPVVAAIGAGWAGVSPPRSGWSADGLLPAAALRAAVADGVAAVLAATPPGATAAVLAGVRARIWGRPLVPERPSVPAGLAFAAESLGFLSGDEPAQLYRRGPWLRLTLSRGHVLSRASLLGR